MTGFKDAEYWKKLPKEKKVRCLLCPHECFIENGEAGKCNVRQNMGGKLKVLNFNHPYISSFIDVDDNVYHFFPGKQALAIGALGDNLYGKFYNSFDTENTPVLNQTALKTIKQAEKSGIIDFVGEPFVYYEFMNDILKKSKDLKSIVNTKGYVNTNVLKKMKKLPDAIVFEIRAMNQGFYENICFGNLDNVLKTIKQAYEKEMWIEIKMPIIPHIHMEFYDVRKLVSWILNNLNENIPLHFVIAEKLKNLKVPLYDEILKKARKIAMDAGMNYVYTDDIKGDGKTTFCPNCKKSVIIRDEKIENFLKNGKCSCGQEISGVWQ